MTCRYSTIFIFLFVLTIAANGQSSAVADSLFAAGDYTSAAVEYERCYYLATSRTNGRTALENKAQCYKRMGSFDRAAATLERYATTYDDYQQLALCQYLASDFEKAAASIVRCQALADTIGTDLLLIKTLTLNELLLYDSALSTALTLASQQMKRPAFELAHQLYTLYSTRPQAKSEQTARRLSYIPGMGHLYARQWDLGMTAFTLNAALLSFGVWQVIEGCYLTAWVGGAGLLSATYPGQMRSAEAATRQYNRQQADTFNAKARQFLLDTFAP
ncbi:MAG: tetratricopeptide repeat protein [Bacteroidales bacterium]|nr:tetratricopeptide repeat protein [Bacteroidales bacterium]